MNKPRIGRPKGDGTYKMIGVYGTEQEIAAVLELTPRERLEAMLATLEARSNDPDWMPPPVYACTCGRGVEVEPMYHALGCEMYVPF
jgi:hypothetical protein